MMDALLIVFWGFVLTTALVVWSCGTVSLMMAAQEKKRLEAAKQERLDNRTWNEMVTKALDAHSTEHPYRALQWDEHEEITAVDGLARMPMSDMMRYDSELQ